ncbi:hypothetical protein EOA32_22420 [Mesorhizobium sp. M1A.F.Ca.ET.072.01.1.1]|uniref:hypothetical protein n=1 Tax=Mesorhizobium sp. M1A.F.Ca.ET.072.01.1.1 TaxID=2496753 RepID=UPI000FD4ABBF|nr:hypothetical protein [Mesorhizobium sp. M1A.F.Ca.ET.072.01.1.1]RUW49466.1 hypothetical protein EOA32_22420 [Mesorhizobium sp. M1A.F.Ca.ET.072.01.1.1]TIV04125.1 MAG: hypothetical protein E5W04_05110 [Mesorhizobium sp.]
MSNYVLFQMWSFHRQTLIKGHQFYVDQARKRVLSQFDNIEEEAEKAAADWLEQNSNRFDPDRHDPSDFYEAAHEASIEFYELLSDMRDQTWLSVVAGMFHQWDKRLREWLVQEIRHWHCGETVIAKVWGADFGKIADLLESLGWEIRSTAYFKALDALRLVVNVYKHGDGNSLNELKKTYPEYLEDRLVGSGLPGTLDLLDHTNLRVSDDQFQAFADAIIAFWRDVPDNVSGNEIAKVPDWFEKAILSDRKSQNKLAFLGYTGGT